ncbi:hypothetical protein LTR08_008893 [Meristemomyces frigidus]|nr:hypothetical protein LTR08_008893 [Meristemomyces frigidus]
MADRLTQLQDALDNQLTMMYAALNYIQAHHPYGDIPGQASQAPAFAPITPPSDAAPHPPANGSLTNGSTIRPQPNGTAQPSQPPADDAPSDPHRTIPPDRPAVFHSALRELAQGLVLQEQQIEYLVNSLPGLGNSEESQVRRMRELEAELREVEAERAKAEEEKEKMVDMLGALIGKVNRVP